MNGKLFVVEYMNKRHLQLKNVLVEDQIYTIRLSDVVAESYFGYGGAMICQTLSS